ncbi:receptor-like protein 56 [Mangifera indica]|uniref:receptor-like protein 56 n=1 Tax=Mangifera indica TaxID=29780 RepID=UPI001CFA44B0|nr:receptor-like protein 56 [Mangifera indica]
MSLIKLLLMFVIVLVQIHGFKGFSEKERIGLLELKSFIKSVNDYKTDEILVSWVDDKASNCCEWERVQCNATTGHVIKLSLSYTRQFNYNEDFQGYPTLNLSLFHPFEELENLDLSLNYFGGWHENKGLGNLKNLKWLDLSDNNINTSLANLGLQNLRSLKELYMRENGISGSLALLGLANMTNLKTLDLSSNQINTSLASLGLANMTNLKTLDLSSNQINTSLASLGLQNIKSLEELYMHDNGINGSFTLLVLAVEFN